jgi:glycosyltransferase involved in cell wall biosynthesis
MRLINILYLHAGAELYGADIVLLQLIKGLDKTRFTPHVILPNDGPLVEELKNINVEVSVFDYPILRRKYFNPKGMLQYSLSFKKAASHIEKYCKDKDINIIHSNTSAVLEGAYVAKKLKLKHLWHIHEIITRPKAIFKFLSYIIATSSHEVIAVSEATKSHMIESGYFAKDQVKVIYNGVDNSKFKPENDSAYIRRELGFSEEDIVVGMIGRVNSWKGQGDFLQAVNKVLGNYAKAKAILVGGVFEGEEWRMKELKEKAAVSSYASRIIIEEFRKDSANVHSLFDIFVLPSTQPDPLPTVVLEAMATGKPVVAYRHGGVTEMVKEDYNGLFAEVCNPEKLGEKIEVLLNNEELRLEMGRNSLERQKEYFSLNSYIRNFEKTYENLIK